MLHAERSTRGCGAANEAWVPRPATQPPQSPATCASGTCNAEAKSLFDLLSTRDRDGNGTLSAGEVATTRASGLMSDVFGSIDSDGNGELNASEVDFYESAVDEVLAASGSPAGIAQILARPAGGSEDRRRDRHGSSEAAHGDHGHGHHGRDRSGITVDEARAREVPKAPVGVPGTTVAGTEARLATDVLKGAATERTTNDGATGFVATTLGSSIFHAVSGQVGESGDTARQAQKYADALKVLKG